MTQVWVHSCINCQKSQQNVDDHTNRLILIKISTLVMILQLQMEECVKSLWTLDFRLELDFNQLFV